METMAQGIYKHFTLNDLKSLCQALSIDYKNLSGTKQEKVDALLLNLYQRGHEKDLKNYLYRSKPNVAWDELTYSLPGTPETEVQVPPVDIEKLAREHLLQNIKAIWIDGYLEQALHRTVAVELKLKDQDERRPWGLVLQTSARSKQSIPSRKSVYQVFEESNRSLLILGDSGSGKTYSLLELAQELLELAMIEEAEPIPLVLNLSSWGNRRPPLTEWIAEEAFVQYQLARGITKSWLEEDRFLLLLDGLDEVAETFRERCISALSRFKANHKAKMVVCGRTADYKELKKELKISKAILIQPLSKTKIDRYLEQFGRKTATLRDALTRDEELSRLAESPLMLNLMAVAYEGVTKSRMPEPAPAAETRQRLFTDYVAKMFDNYPLPEDGYEQEQVEQWLTNLAYGMQEHNQSTFYIEQLQPTWLPRSQFLPYQLIGRVLLGVLIVLIVTLFSGIAIGLLFGISFGIFFGLLSPEVKLVEQLQFIRLPSQKFLQTLQEGLVGRLSGGLTGGLSAGLIVGLFFELIAGLQGGLIVGLMLGLVFGVSDSLIYGLNVFVQKGIVSQQEFIPNQGIANARLNAPRMMLVFGLFFGLILGPVVGLNSDLVAGLVVGFCGGLIVGLLGYGGETVLKHYTLRFLLKRNDALPAFAWRQSDEPLINFLDDMVTRLFLRRVGGGWMFIHRSLLTHFANQKPELSEEDRWPFIAAPLEPAEAEESEAGSKRSNKEGDASDEEEGTGAGALLSRLTKPLVSGVQGLMAGRSRRNEAQTEETGEDNS